MSSDSPLETTNVNGSDTAQPDSTIRNPPKTNPTFRAAQRPADKKVTEWLIDQKAIGADYDYPHKKRRYIHLKPQIMFNNLVDLYAQWFSSVWNHISKVAEEFSISSSDNTSRTKKLARIYISCWFLDLYCSIRLALSKTDNTALGQKYSTQVFPTTIRYDVYLTDLLNAIRPTHIVHNTADEMLIPLIANAPDFTGHSPFEINDFNASIQTMLGINRIMLDKKLCAFGHVTDATTGTPAWLFDYVKNNPNEDAALYAWFPSEGNYNSEDLVLAFIIGCACSPRIGPVEIGEWQWFPRNSGPNWIPPAYPGAHVSTRHNYGSVEITTCEVQKHIPVPNYYYEPNAATTGSGPLYLPASTTTTHTEVSLDENTEVPQSPTIDATMVDTSTNADIVYTHRYRYVTTVYHAQVVRKMHANVRFAALLAYLHQG